MQECNLIKAEKRVTQEYTAEEVEALRAIATKRISEKRLRRMFPDRTIPALRIKMFYLRRDMGLTRTSQRGSKAEPAILSPDDPGIDDTMHSKMVEDFTRGSGALLEALLRAMR